ncbi:hypothetical protein TrVE_jg13648 [Triparma verrucosa]|uniref:Transmembrane protein n=1 Tax=Triparma verrucosa TaxID=1606542 RepID=A0A9W7CF19_9STRA|nr:hypothetical protein TrVE_jg13648 [Triparma verrucosa]
MSFAPQLQTVLDLIEDERHLEAEKLYSSLLSSVPPSSSSSSSKASKIKFASKASKDLQKYHDLHSQNVERLEKLKRVAAKMRTSKEALSSSENWTVAQTLFGITTSYRREADDTLSIKLEGELSNVPLFEQLCVLRETDLFHLWAPFVPRSKKLLQVTKIELVSWFIISVPIFGLSRDAVFHAYGCDCMEESGSVIICAESVDEFPGADIPPEPKGWGGARMIVRSFSGLVTILSPTDARTCLIANIDPRLSLPQKLIDFSMKKMCGVLLLCLQKMAKKIVKNPKKSEHAKHMRSDKAFYEDWLLPKFQAYCDKKGWVMPPVGALNVPEYTKKSSSFDEEADDFVVSEDGGKTFSSLSDITDDGSSSMSSGGTRGKSRSVLSRAVHKVSKKVKERKEKKLEKERQEILREAEANMTKINHVSPKLMARYGEWTAAKPSDVEDSKSLGDRLYELPLWPLEFGLVQHQGLKALGRLLGGSDYGPTSICLVAGLITILNCAGLFFATFGGLQNAKSRRSGTLSETRNFATGVVTCVVGVVVALGAIGCRTYTFLERYYLETLRHHNFLPDPYSFPMYNDLRAWNMYLLARYSKFCTLVFIFCALVAVCGTVLIKFKKEVSATGLGEKMFKTFAELNGGGMAKARKGTVVKNSKEERRQVLADKLQKRRELAAKRVG